MEEQELTKLQGRNLGQIRDVLSEFNPKLRAQDNWYTIWRSVFSILEDDTCAEIFPMCLNTVRILSRDQASLETHEILQDVNCLLRLAHLLHNDLDPGLSGTRETEEEEGATASGGEIAAVPLSTVIEAVKCLCNLVFQSLAARKECVKCNVAENIFRRLAFSGLHCHDLQLYDMKLLFLLTALEPETHRTVQIETNGIVYMIEWLNQRLAESETHTDSQLEMICEVLKIMFNITTNSENNLNQNLIQHLHVVKVMRELLVRFGEMREKSDRTVVTHVINLLTNISGSCYTELLVQESSVQEQELDEAKALSVEPEVISFDVLGIILRYLEVVLEEYSQNSASHELVQPVLTVLVKCVRCNRNMRHHIREKVLPPLKDAAQRPELGHELRNRLCALLTLPISIVRDLAAELLFVCCKENVGRMIKYTGYGNAAGLLANRGLLDGRMVLHDDYSSDSGDSDTEEYKQLLHGINPVTGCYQPPSDNPLEGMSEEQKEYEAMELVNLMEKLQRTGLIQPCRIGEDGKPQPVEHILQLQDELPKQKSQQMQ